MLAELKNSISWRVASEAVTIFIAGLAVIGTFENIANIKFRTIRNIFVSMLLLAQILRFTISKID